MKKIRVIAYPYSSNPYQNLLYTNKYLKNEVQVTYLYNKFLDEKFLILGIILLPIRILIVKIKGYHIFHLHWLYTFSLPTSDLASNTVAQIYFFSILILIKVIGFKLVYTVHNLFPHEKQFLNDKLALRTLCSLTNAIIVHSKYTMDELIKLKINTKNTYVIPHGNYNSIYSINVTKKKARELLNINTNDFVFLIFGFIRPYKGVLEIIKEFKKISQNNPNCKLLIAGRCIDEVYKSKILENKRILGDKLILHLKHVEDSDLPYYFAAANTVVYGFKRITTSGSVMLGLTFKKILIIPLLGELKDFEDKTLGYEANNKESLYSSMLYSIKLNNIIKRNKIRKMKVYITETSWDRIAKKTANLYGSIS